jgi:type IX secretion system PorP/SprF family membrane protein
MTLRAFAQDPEFSQYYAAPLYLNPAFAGSASDHRFIANHRNQWPSITNGFVTYAFSWDVAIDQYKSGIGFLLTVDKAGTAGLKSTQFNFQYAYKIPLGEKWIASAGLNFGVANRTIDFNKLIFGDELCFDCPDAGGTSQDRLNLQSKTYFDFGAGGLIYSRKIWFGFSAAHLNTPNRSLLDEDASIPVKTTVHGGIRIPLYHGMLKKDRVSAIAPSFVYKSQGNFDQLDVGTYFLYEPVILGLWYRGIPIRQNIKDNISQDAVVVILGFQLSKIELSYSYDLTVSELGPSSGGTHEIAIKYSPGFGIKARGKKREKFIPCPTFVK